ncbi:hypothetical protein XF_1394 [Xylella fastidiosa 9a5c]|uniref:Uncharacterized protein n=1 Tax=Xylella fastidiosa (strain 9a5c) TaxID=160492 RepID=Q9PDI5_XYLFA|nr:hypothetical protein XF_1394 [Xylella fastidiosa 9a5c]
MFCCFHLVLKVEHNGLYGVSCFYKYLEIFREEIVMCIGVKSLIYG